MVELRLSVSDFVALTNQTLEYAYPSVVVEGEVASFKVNQSKYVFFDLKDQEASVGCFMTVWQLRMPIEDGMKVVVSATPKLTQRGKFSLTVRSIQPSGQGALKKSFELLKVKLEDEGLFAAERKRSLPPVPKRVAVITSTQAAGYADFVKILDDRWGGLKIEVAHVQVQGTEAPDQIIRAVKYFNEQEILADALVIIRGGGSADDLATFNDELLARAIAASRIPTLVGVGHETDESLADLVADVRASTPSNAAQILVPDRRELIRNIYSQMKAILQRIKRVASERQVYMRDRLSRVLEQIGQHHQRSQERLGHFRQVLAQIDPKVILRRGYALLRGQPEVGKSIEIETYKAIIRAKVESYDEK